MYSFSVRLNSFEADLISKQNESGRTSHQYSDKHPGPYRTVETRDRLHKEVI